MFPFAPAGNGGPGRPPPAALPLCAAAASSITPAALAAGGAVFVTLLLTGFTVPQAEWFALLERIDEMKERPRDFWRHFAGVLLALSGLDAVSDVAGVVAKPVVRRGGRALCVVAAKAIMLHALLVLALGSFVSDPQLGDRQVNLLPFLPGDYAGQWAELAVAVLGDVLLLAVIGGAGMRRLEIRSALDGAGDAEFDRSGPVEMTPTSATARHDG